MMEKYRLLFESIFKRKLTDESTVGYLENITKEHPYFSVAQFYLLQLLQKDVNGYQPQVKKTAVLFNNNHWLNFQLLEAGYNNRPPAAAKSIIAEQPAAEIIADKIFTEEKTEEEIPVAAEEQQLHEEINTHSETIFEEEKNIAAVEEEQPVIETTASKEEETIEIEQPVEEINIIPAPDDIKPIAEEIAEPVIENVQPAEELIAAPVINGIQPAAEEITEPIIEKAKEEAAPLIEPLLFEPLHTTDYFASVGIKLSEEEKASGKLGKQLMSFTEWLKTMKKTHSMPQTQTTAADTEATSAESSIQKLAEKSNQENDVITEAMAEVLLQQGRQAKAIEILEKLSLLNPGKSPYFAAKINQIKES